MKRNKKAEKYRDFLRKDKELYKNLDAQRNLGYELLDTPIHKGYDGVWSLRDDISRRIDAREYESLIHHYGKSVWCKDESFTKYDRELKREVDIKPYFKKIPESEYDTLLPWIKRFFSYSLGDDKTLWGGGVKRFYRVNVPEYCFKLKITKHYITRYQVIDEVLLQEEAEIKQTLDTTYRDIRIKDLNRHFSKKSDKQIFNRAFRSSDKMTINKNIKFLFDDFDEDDSWNDEVKGLKYKHRNSVKWNW